MKVLVTGSDGYIGTVLVPLLLEAGHDVTGLDSYLFEECDFGEPALTAASIRADIRDVTPQMLEGFDAVVHLAAVSNDPMGDLDPECTFAINHRGSVHLAKRAREAGVQRFLFSSSCSLYGAADTEALLDESASFNPVTPYGQSKVLAERDLAKLAAEDFSPAFMRNATVYGVSPRLRADLVVNNLVAYAHTTGEILLMSDGSPWRPLIHVEDLSRACLALLEAPRGLIHNRAYNVGRLDENYQIREVAEIVRKVMPSTRITYARGAGPDSRSYRVDFSKFHDLFPEAGMTWTVRDGVEELARAYEEHGLTTDQFQSHRLIRLEQIKRLMGEGRLDGQLRWKDLASSAKR